MKTYKNTGIFLHFMIELTEIAKKSKCERSKCGSMIINSYGYTIGEGYNSRPCDIGGACTKPSLPNDFKSDKSCCVHAEQRAIMQALKNHPKEIAGSTLYFLRLNSDDGIDIPAYSGKPWCTVCSKLALDVGIKDFVLMHEDGWTYYDTEEYNKLSFEYKR